MGSLRGSLPRAPRQNAQLGLPLQLMKEEAAVLLSYGVARLVNLRNNVLSKQEEDAFQEARKKSFEKQKAFYIEKREEDKKQFLALQPLRSKKKKKRKSKDDPSALTGHSSVSMIPITSAAPQIVSDGISPNILTAFDCRIGADDRWEPEGANVIRDEINISKKRALGRQKGDNGGTDCKCGLGTTHAELCKRTSEEISCTKRQKVIDDITQQITINKSVETKGVETEQIKGKELGTQKKEFINTSPVLGSADSCAMPNGDQETKFDAKAEGGHESRKFKGHDTIKYNNHVDTEISHFKKDNLSCSRTGAESVDIRNNDKDLEEVIPSSDFKTKSKLAQDDLHFSASEEKDWRVNSCTTVSIKPGFVKRENNAADNLNKIQQNLNIPAHSFQDSNKKDAANKVKEHAVSIGGNKSSANFSLVGVPGIKVKGKKGEKFAANVRDDGCLVQLFTGTPHAEYDVIPEWDFPSTEKDTIRVRVFQHFWEQGYFLTSGVKFGGDFLVYKGDPILYHSTFISVCVPYQEFISPLKLVSYGRLGPIVKKTVVLCSLNDSDEVVCISLQWSGVS